MLITVYMVRCISSKSLISNKKRAGGKQHLVNTVLNRERRNLSIYINFKMVLSVGMLEMNLHRNGESPKDGNIANNAPCHSLL